VETPGLAINARVNKFRLAHRSSFMVKATCLRWHIRRHDVAASVAYLNSSLNLNECVFSATEVTTLEVTPFPVLINYKLELLEVSLPQVDRPRPAWPPDNQT